MRYLDLLIYSDLYYIDADDNLKKKYPPLNKKIVLDKGLLWLSPISDRITQKIFDLKEDGFNFTDKNSDYIRRAHCLYAIGLENIQKNNIYNWDKDRKIQTVVALSRLIKPTSISFEYCGKLRVNSNDEIDQIILKTNFNINQAFILKNERNWLTQIEGERLKDLYQFYKNNELKGALQKAFWYHEYASRLMELDVRITLISSGIEALINTNKTNATKQFVDRFCLLANHVKENISKTKADKIYNLRSILVHGQQIDNKFDKNTKLYFSMETVLRKVLRKAIEDKEFALKFKDKKNIEKNFPL